MGLLGMAVRNLRRPRRDMALVAFDPQVGADIMAFLTTLPPEK